MTNPPEFRAAQSVPPATERTDSLFDWVTFATADLADSFERLNHDLDNREKDPHWERKVWRDSLDIISLRRWAFLFPGGGALRRRTNRVPQPIPPANRQGWYQAGQRVSPAQPSATKGVYPAVEEVE